MRIVIGLMIGAVLAVAAVGCRRDSPVRLSVADGLSALTNRAHFARTPVGHSGLARFHGMDAGIPEDDEWVEVISLEGPGRLDRLWSDAGAALRWRFYFDNELAPRLELGTLELFGGSAPFLPPLAESVSGGRVSYVPLPYRHALRITAGAAPDRAALSNLSVQVNYRRYDPARTVGESYGGSFSQEELNMADAVRTLWQEPADALQKAAAACGPEREHVLNPGSTAVWLNEKRSGILDTFRLRLTFPPQAGLLDRALILQSLVLRMTWDDAAQPSVNVPLGHFFVNAERSRRFASLPLGVIADYDFVCRFPMPYMRGARAELYNDGQLPVTLHASSLIKTGRPARRERNYFHAAWQQQAGDATRFTAARIEGQGHIAGMMLNAFALTESWRLFEGVDVFQQGTDAAEEWRGTGLAAAFNGGALFFGLYDRPLAGLVETRPIRALAYRWLLAERPDFGDGIEISWSFENLPPEPRALAATVYWYQPQPLPAPVAPTLTARELPADPLGGASIMCALLELERIGHVDEARDLSIEYYERFPGLITSDFLRIRALAYQQRISGFPAVVPFYHDILSRVKGTMVGRELERWLWLHRATDHGLMATQINGKFRAYLNGRRIEQGDNPHTLVARPVRFMPGTNEVTVKVIPVRTDAWMSVYIMTHGSPVVSGLDWEFTRQRPSDWPGTTCPEPVWSPVGGVAQFPLPRWWRLEPNIYPYMQSARQLVRPWSGPGWTEPPYEETYFRRRFIMPEDLAESDFELPDVLPSIPEEPVE